MLLGRFAITAETFHVSFGLEEVHFGAYLNANEAKQSVWSSEREPLKPGCYCLDVLTGVHFGEFIVSSNWAVN